MLAYIRKLFGLNKVEGNNIEGNNIEGNRKKRRKVQFGRPINPKSKWKE